MHQNVSRYILLLFVAFFINFLYLILSVVSSRIVLSPKTDYVHAEKSRIYFCHFCKSHGKEKQNLWIYFCLCLSSLCELISPVLNAEVEFAVLTCNELKQQFYFQIEKMYLKKNTLNKFIKIFSLFH